MTGEWCALAVLTHWNEKYKPYCRLTHSIPFMLKQNTAGPKKPSENTKHSFISLQCSLSYPACRAAQKGLCDTLEVHRWTSRSLRYNIHSLSVSISVCHSVSQREEAQADGHWTQAGSAKHPWSFTPSWKQSRPKHSRAMCWCSHSASHTQPLDSQTLAQKQISTFDVNTLISVAIFILWYQGGDQLAPIRCYLLTWGTEKQVWDPLPQLFSFYRMEKAKIPSRSITEEWCLSTQAMKMTAFDKRIWLESLVRKVNTTARLRRSQWFKIQLQSHSSLNRKFKWRTYSDSHSIKSSWTGSRRGIRQHPSLYSGSHSHILQKQRMCPVPQGESKALCLSWSDQVTYIPPWKYLWHRKLSV